MFQLSHPKENNFAINYETLDRSTLLEELKQSLKVAQAKLEEAKSAETRFENTILRIELAKHEIEYVAAVFDNLIYADSDDVLEKQMEEFSSLVSDFNSKLFLDVDLASKVKELYEGENLSGEEAHLVTKLYETFEDSGATFDEKTRARFSEIDKEINLGHLKFGQNNLKEIQTKFFHVTDESMLAGIPERLIEGARERAKKEKVEGYAFGLEAPVRAPVLKFAKNPDFRKGYFHLSRTISYQGENENISLIKKLLTLHQEKATLLGFNNPADMILKRRMAQSSEKAISFSKEIYEKIKTAAAQDFEKLKALKAKELDQKISETTLHPYDFAYYAEKLTQEEVGINDEEIKEYFPLSKVMDGLFDILNSLYGIRFVESSLKSYHADVKVYECLDKSGNFLGHFHVDLFYRPSKKGGAWMTFYLPQGQFGGESIRGEISICCNFEAPKAGEECYLTSSEVLTLFHETGHAMHSMLSDVKYATLHGVNVQWDFVELPSQIMENWFYQPEVLKKISEHKVTKESLPDHLIQGLIKSEKFLAPLYKLRQLTFGLIDLDIHTKMDVPEDIVSYEREFLSQYDLFSYPEDTCFLTAFGHIFAGGYTAGYYSYLWAEVLDADAFDDFKKAGIYDQATGEKFRREILSRGGSAPAAELWQNYKGREPDVNPLIDRFGV